MDIIIGMSRLSDKRPSIYQIHVMTTNTTYRFPGSRFLACNGELDLFTALYIFIETRSTRILVSVDRGVVIVNLESQVRL
jgi:hypothetical protein